MDRKTLLAFLLIAVIILLTPAYYNIVFPPPEVSEADSSGIGPVDTLLVDDIYYQKAVESAVESVFKEKEFIVENDLYLATVSSINGGSIKSFKLKKYPHHLGGNVELINERNRNNLLVSYRDIEGNNVVLNNAWEPISAFSPGFINSKTELSFRNLNNDVYIYKTLTFDPENYTIDVKTDLSPIRPNLSQGYYSLSWSGGMPITEKNKTDDLGYINGYIYQGGETHSPDISDIGSPNVDHIKGETLWAAVRTKYFVSALIPNRPCVGGRASAFTAHEEEEKIYNVSLTLSAENASTLLYLGPLEYHRIKQLGVGLDSIMNFGWSFIRPISKGVHFLLIKMNNYIPNYGVILIIFSLLVKILVYPLTKQSYESTQKMQAIQPELNALKEKYKNDQQKFSQAQISLFKERGVNPLGGCFPILLQMPLLFALFQVFRSTIELRGAPFVLWIKDLSAPDAIINLPFHIPIYGGHIAVLPILMGVTMFIQQKMMPTQVSGQQKFMSYFMTGFFTLLFNNFPSGLNLYYTLFNALTIVQQKFFTPAPSIPSPTR